MSQKRRRSRNFTLSEKHKLIRLVDIYKNIILSKKTDGRTNQAKNRAWIKITNELNNKGFTLRSKASLLRFWEKIKCEAKSYKTRRKNSAVRVDPCVEQVCEMMEHASMGRYGYTDAESQLISEATSPLYGPGDLEVVVVENCETIPDIKEEITNNCEDDENGPVSPSPSSSSSQHCETLPDWKRRRIIQDDNDRTEVVSTLCGTFNDLNAKKLAAEDLKIKILEDELRFKKELQQLQLEIARKELAIKTEVYNQVRDGTMNPHNLIGFTKHD
ncbi:uncharacterized protein LOC142983942 isoform X2 [Anticarsia gemmatalis]|uniref:uncharacterized protein LOC142983942 isoform X2 n=1 Tax=Anticarsia gemmatalis TaxID=129554 RepID=UPI003F768CC9